MRRDSITGLSVALCSIGLGVGSLSLARSTDDGPAHIVATDARPADGGVVAGSSGDARSGANASGKPGTTSRYLFEGKEGRLEMFVTFLPKNKIQVAVSRERSDGCKWSKTLKAHFSAKQEMSDENTDNITVDEYQIDAGQLHCDMFIDIEEKTGTRAEMSAFKACADVCRLPGGVGLMFLQR